MSIAVLAPFAFSKLKKAVLRRGRRLVPWRPSLDTFDRLGNHAEMYRERKRKPAVDEARREKGREMIKRLTAIIEREDGGCCALCPELDIASQGDSVEEARDNLREALELFFETASPEEIADRSHQDLYITQVEIAVG